MLVQKSDVAPILIARIEKNVITKLAPLQRKNAYLYVLLVHALQELPVVLETTERFVLATIHYKEMATFLVLNVRFNHILDKNTIHSSYI